MVSLLRALKDRRVRASAASTLAASAGVPDSGFVFVGNSQGASAAIAELSSLLGDTLESIEIGEDEPGDQLRFQLSQLDAEASKYINSRLDETKCRSWTCARPDAAIIDMAAQCAAAVYDQQIEPNVQGFKLIRQLYRPSTELGTEKATLFTLAQPLRDGEYHESLPLLVISIRGTASAIDYLVNLNAVAKDAQGFINLPRLKGNSISNQDDDDDSDNNNGSSNAPEAIDVHSGFLNSAKSLIPAVTELLGRAIKQRTVRHVLFTGHSAGGAVASLLFAHFLSNAASTYQSFRFSSITFGSPPVVEQDITPLLLGNHVSAAHRGLVLNFANEYDLVPRAGRSYIRSLVDLFRSIYSLPKIQDQGTVDDDRRVLQGLTGSDVEDWMGIGNRRPPLPTWELPPADLFHIGQVIVFKAGCVDREDEMKGGCWGKGSSDRGTRLDVRAYVVRSEEFAKLLFCRVSVHKRQIYLENVKEIAEGRLHGNSGW